MSQAYLIVNFGGPRNLDEIRPFLTELLTDTDVIRTNLPATAQKLLFKRIAKKRSMSIKDEYAKMGNRSPIFDDTETVAIKLPLDTLTFHRYLPTTHAASLAAIENCTADEIIVVPLFPQFSYATTGSIARLFEQKLSQATQLKLRWIKSYYNHPAFIEHFASHIKKFLAASNLLPEDTCLFFSPHGVPTSFICSGDPYQAECEAAYQEIMKHFSGTQSILAYQSKFGPAQWLRPYTDEICASIKSHVRGHPIIVFIPLSFTSDHVETLVEVEDQYLPVIRRHNLTALRCPAFNTDAAWIDALQKIIHTSAYTSNRMLIRDPKAGCPGDCRSGLCPYVQPLVSCNRYEKHSDHSINSALSQT